MGVEKRAGMKSGFLSECLGMLPVAAVHTIFKGTTFLSLGVGGWVSPLELQF